MSENKSKQGESQSPGQAASDIAGVYRDAILREAPRVLSLLDRERFSPTFGCLDRTYWSWKFTDFPGARFQEGVCALSFLYTQPLPDSPYYQNPNLLEWTAGAFDFWARIQRESGDYDEAYPWERSLAATAFTAFYAAEAWSMIGESLPRPTADRFRLTLTRAAGWLTNNDEKHGFLSNHLAAAAAALQHAFQITGEDRFDKRSRYFLSRILDHQSAEGWYEEYGGADPGYQTHGSFYLARFWELTADAKLLASLEKSIEFLSHFIHPDGSVGGEYTSRNTQTYYPAAFEILAPVSARAASIADRMRSRIPASNAAGLQCVDIYNYFPFLNNFISAFRAANQNTPRQPSAPAPDAPSTLHLPQSGLLKVTTPRYELYVGLKKGGMWKLFDRARQRLVASDSGYAGRLRNGGFISNQWFEPERRYQISEKEITVSGPFYRVNRPLMNPPRFVIFRIATAVLGRVPAFAYWMKSLLVKVLIYRNRKIDLHCERRFILLPDGIEIIDRLQGDAHGKVESLALTRTFTSIHMGSSRYFVSGDLLAPPPIEKENPIDTTQLPQGIELRTRCRLAGSA